MKFKKTFVLLGLVFLQQLSIAQEAYVQNYTTYDGLSSNQVYHVMQSRTGALWFCTDNGVSVFDGKNFTNYKTSDGLTDNVVFEAMEDKAGRIWFKPMNGRIFYYENNKFHSLKVYPRLDKILQNGRYFIKSLACDAAGNIIFGKSESYLYRLDAARGFNALDSIYLYHDKNTLCVSLDYNKVLFTSSPGLSRPEAIKLNGRVVTIKTVARLVITANMVMFNDTANHKLYIASDESLVSIDCITSEVERYVVPDMLSLFKPVNNELWINTRNGIWIFGCGRKLEYKTKLLTEYIVSHADTDYQGNIWCTTTNNGVFKLPRGYGDGFYTRDLSDYQVVLPLTDSTILTTRRKDKTLYLYNIFTARVRELYRFPMYITNIQRAGKKIYLSTDFLYTLEPPLFAPKKIDIGTYARDITAQNGTSYFINHMYAYAIDSSGSVFKCNAFTGRGCCIAVYDGKVLVGSTFGIFVFNRENKLINFNNIHFRVDKMLPGPGNRLFLLNHSTGIFSIDPRTHRLDTLASVDKLKCGRVNDMAIDAGKLFFAAKTGLFRYNFSKHKILSIDESNGLVTNDVKNIYVQGGRMFLGFNNYIQWVDTSAFLTPVTSLRFQLNNITVNGRKDTVKAHMCPDQNNIVMRFSLYAFSRNTNTRLQAYVTGNNNFTPHRTWFDLEEEKLILANLSPGEYMVYVRAINSQDVAGKQVKYVYFSINKPYWQQAWFIALCILGFILCIAGLLWYAIRYTRRRTLRQAELYRMIEEYKFKVLRTQINPHFIFNSLNSIQANILKDEKEISYTYLNNFARFFRKVLQNADREFITVEEEMEMLEMYLAIESGRFKHTFTYEITAQPVTIKLYLPALLLQPLVENSVRHGVGALEKGRGKIKVDVDIVNEKLVIDILDNGPGFPAQDAINDRHEKTDSKGMVLTRGRINLLNEKYGDSSLTVGRIEIAGEQFTRVRIELHKINTI